MLPSRPEPGLFCTFDHPGRTGSIHHLFRCNKYVKFECLVETPMSIKGQSRSQYLLNNITFKHRIAETAQVSRRKMPSELTKKHPSGTWFALSIPLLMSAYMFFFGEPIYTNYIFVDDTGKEIDYRVKFRLDSITN